LDESEAALFEEKNLTDFFVQDWLKRFENDEKIKSTLSRLSQIGD
jgi:hypothetical protein